MRCSNGAECRADADIDWNESSGDAVCVRCGTVCEESTIVASVEFTEGAGGAGRRPVRLSAVHEALRHARRELRVLWKTQVRLST